jgi:predicted TIM-barrel fold metal-dependent hydrolase
MPTDLFEIVDVHLHAWCINQMETISQPHKPAVLDEKVFNDTLAQMDQLNICCGVLSGADNVTLEWCRRAPGRFIPSWDASIPPSDPGEEAVLFTEALETQGFRGMGELVMQARGLAPNDERFFPLYRICQERRLPVFFHTGLNGPDWPRYWPSFRVSLCNPLLLEDVIAAFPDLVIVMAHMSYPFTDQATYMLLSHSNVYMDVATVNWYIGRAGFHRLLRQVVETVGADKILFGSDQMNVPQMIPVGVRAIQEAPFLSEEDKCKILGDNARKLLGITVITESR